ncbi:MAG: hypothetical protein IKS48_08135 [Eubacterium sp.]|nr:hypothetical protein [Eubacterium sp.]
MNILTLTKIELINYLGINELRHSKDSAVRKNKGFLFGTIIFLLVVFAGYIAGQTVGMAKLGLTEYIPVIYFAAAFIANICMGIYKAKETIYREKDLDQMSAFPVSGVSVVASRILRMYIDNFLLGLGIIVPAMIVYGINAGVGLGSYVSLIPLCIILPILPSAIAAWVGILFAAVIARNRHKVLTEVILALVLVFGSFLISGIISAKAGVGTPGASAHKEEINSEMSAEFSKMISERMTELENAYPLMKTMGDIMKNADLTGFIIYTLISIMVLVLTVLIIGENFFSISRSLFNTQTHREYIMEGMKRKSVMTSLIKKEAARYFSSGIYVTNTIIGLIMAVAFAIALGFFDIETIISSAGNIPVDLNYDAGIGFIVAMMFGLMSITASSISIEGKNWWIVRTLPLSSKEVLGAKLLFNLIVVAPFYILAELIMIFTVKCGVMGRIWLIIIPVMAILFSVLLGLFLNIKLPKFNWEKELDVVKQSAAVGFSLLGGLVVIIFGIGVMIIPIQYENIYNLGFTIAMSVICIWLYKRIIYTRLEDI